MRNGCHIVVIIPALDEEKTIGTVLLEIPDWVDQAIVADNNSKDHTARVASANGAQVVFEPRRGYGAACLKAIRELESLVSKKEPVVIAFLDGDLSDRPKEMSLLVDPITEGRFDFAVGSRVLGDYERGALTMTQRFGNRLSCFLLKMFFDTAFTDLGPFRAIRWDSLQALKMDDLDFGWTVQMQVRAVKIGLRILEVPVSCRNRAGGRSKVSGTIRGVIGAGTTILSVIAKEAWDFRTNGSPAEVGYSRGCSLQDASDD